ncbi:uncharacterized protein LOC120700963 [Panicum virgatum]|uniref:uncharacterized protein LOC120700963 n=1 Tax=Panicum virgatum TaxID=38727 RepID=UPI0019D51E60|nr:uncharacterized protein LOC120700963 [Panicum virgatum]
MAEVFKGRVIVEGSWNEEGDANYMWKKMATCIRKVASEVFGMTRGGGCKTKDMWWWNEDVQRAIKENKECYKCLFLDRSADNIEKYKVAQKIAKRAMSEAKGRAYEDMYQRLNTKEGEKDIYRMARVHERKTRDFSQLDDSFDDTNRRFVRRILESEVKEALKRMKGGKATCPDGIPVEVWRCLGDIAIVWLTKLFNRIFRSNKMPEEWRRSILVPIYKNKGDIQSCTNYRGIKLMSHTMKLWERVIEHRLRGMTRVTMNQFGFMPGRSTIEAIFLIRHVMERYREQKKDLHMVFIDLEKTYDKIPRNVMWWALDRHKVPTKYVALIKDMYNNVIRCLKGLVFYISVSPLKVKPESN